MPSPHPSAPQPDRLSTLPPELILLITSHLPPNLADPPRLHMDPEPESWTPIFCPRRFLGHPDLVALSRTCKHLHRLLTSELIKVLTAAEEADPGPLGFAIRCAHLGLATKLLKEKWVEATEEKLVHWIGKCFAVNKLNEETSRQEKTRKGVVEVLVKMGAGRKLGRDWHGMMGLKWPGKGRVNGEGGNVHGTDKVRFLDYPTGGNGSPK